MPLASSASMSLTGIVPKRSIRTMLSHADDQTFTNEVLNHHGPVLVEFFTRSCAPCRALEPVLNALASDLRGQLKIVKVDADRAPQTAQNYGVRMAPTLIIFHGGQPQQSINGAPPAARLRSFVEPYLR